jgi:septal ring factor EnvC (AmiA/AmiB activator)
LKASLQLKYSIFLFALVFACIFFAGATYEELISDKKKQLEITERNIIESKNSISGYSGQSAKYRVQIDSIESLVNALNNFLKNYDNESYMTPDQIAIETNMIIFLAEEVEEIQKSFRQKVTNLYKKGKNYELELLMSAKTPNEYLRRNQYLQKFSQNRKKELRDLKSKKFILEEKKKMITLSTSSQRFYVESKRNEKAKLDESLNTLRQHLAGLESESSIYAAKIQRYEVQLGNIKNFINNLEANKENYVSSKNNRTTYESFDLGAVKGNINPPVDIGLITTGFGANADNSTNTIWYSNGVNLSIASGSKVYAVAGGVVSLIGELPYYGKVVIIKHENGYRSVYSCMSEVNVAIGDNIKLSQVIGKSGSTLDGQMLHFELWQNAIPVNPREWIRF